MIDNKIGLDFTNDMLSHLNRYNLDLFSLEHLFITHSHSDHFNYHDLEAKAGPYTNAGNPVLHVYGNQNCLHVLESYMHKFGDYSPYMKLDVAQPYSSVKVEDYTITPLPARHTTYFPEEKALIYLIEHKGKHILYGLDSGWYYEETWNYLQAQHLDTVILDCTNGFLQFPEGNHMGLEDNLKVIEKLTAAKVIDASTQVVSTHFSHNGKVVYDHHREEFEKHGILMAYDGLEIEVE